MVRVMFRPSLPLRARAASIPAATRLALGAALLALLAGCVSPPPAPRPRAAPGAPQRLPELAAFSARLSGGQAVPPSASAGRGELVAVLNRNTGLLQWKLSFSGLSGPVRAAHFHSPGMAGEVADPVLTLGRTVISPLEGRAMLTARQRADLLSGQWYVNLRTAAHPEGEIRGQLIEQK